MTHPENNKLLQNPKDLMVQFEQVEFDIFSHLAQAQNVSLSQLVRELALDELRARIKSGELPVVKEFPADLKQAAEILAATTTQQAHEMVHESSVQSKDS